MPRSQTSFLVRVRRAILRLLKRLITNRTFLVTVGSIVGLFILMNYFIMPWYVNYGGTLTVPNVMGMSLDRATAVLDSMGLEPIQAEIRPDPREPEGRVVLQNPLPDAVVKYGRRIYLTASGGEVYVEVPSLRGRSIRDAQFALERNGLSLGRVDSMSSETYPSGTIVAQELAPEKSIPKGTAVGVTVSLGGLLHEGLVPDLVGKTVAEAEKLLASKGFSLGNITYQTNPDLIPNTVVDQFPRPGDAASSGQAVDLFVVKHGAAPDEIPSQNK